MSKTRRTPINKNQRGSGAPGRTGSRRRQALRPSLFAAAILLFVLTAGLYWGSRSYEFVWDDQGANLTSNQELMSDHYAFFWRHSYSHLYIPVTYSTWIWLKQLSQQPQGNALVLRPEVFRTANILLHAGSTALVLYLLYLLIDSLWPAVAGAVVFAIHPLQVESVVWITEYRGQLSTFFCLVALVLYCRYRIRDNQANTLIVAASLSFALALLSKPSALALPVVIAAFEFLFRPDAGTEKYRWSALWLAATLPVIWITKAVQPDAEIEVTTALVTRPFIAADSMSFYLYKLVAPLHLSISYGRTPATVTGLWYFHLIWIVPAAVAFVAWRNRRARPVIALAMVVIIAGIAPVSGIVPFKGQNDSTVADRYFYFSMIGVGLLVAWAASKLGTKKWFWMIGGAVAVGLIVLNLQQQPVWQNELTLWSHAAALYPGQPRVHNALGVALQAANRHADAIAQFNLALQARPTLAEAYTNRGSSRGLMNDLSGALEDQTRAVELNPTHALVWYNRGSTYYRLGRLPEALRDLDRAAALGFPVPPEIRRALDERIRSSKASGD